MSTVLLVRVNGRRDALPGADGFEWLGITSEKSPKLETNFDTREQPLASVGSGVLRNVESDARVHFNRMTN